MRKRVSRPCASGGREELRVRSCDIVHRVSESSFGNVEKTGDGGDVMGILPGGFGFAVLASPFFVFF